MSQASNAADPAADIVALLRAEAAKCLRLASAERESKRKAGFVGLARSYEETAKEIANKNGLRRRVGVPILD